MKNSFNFTKESLLALPTPETGKRAVYRDTKTHGLQVRVSAGSKTFSIYRRVKGGKPERVTLGRFPAMPLEQARKLAARVNAEIEEGASPAQVKRAHREEYTFGELFREYGERHGAGKKSWRSDQSLYKTHLQPLAPLKISAITKALVSRILSDADKSGRSGATINNIRALVSSVYGRAIEWGLAESNPVTGIKTRKKVKRDRFLQSDELPRFFQSVAMEPNATIRDFILLGLLTGARRSNLLAMRWNDISLKESLWRIPMTKNGEPQNVTLAPEAVAILTERQEAAESGAVYVFPGKSASGHIEEPKYAFIRVMERAGIPYGRKVENGVTLHDLRRTLGSWQAKTGASLAIIGKSLNHRSLQATMIYARLDVDPVRQSVNAATSAMLEAGTLKETADIVMLQNMRKGTA
jgi:integrase